MNCQAEEVRVSEGKVHINLTCNLGKSLIKTQSQAGIDPNSDYR